MVAGQTYGVNCWLTRIHTQCMLARMMMALLMTLFPVIMTNIARGIMLITVNPRYVVGSVMVLLLVYWVPATLYTVVDLFRPACLYKYKVTTYS